MSDSQSPSDQVGRDVRSSRAVRGRTLRFLVPIPKGKGVGAKAAWVGRRIVLWYVIILVMLALFQRRLIYQPTTGSIDPEFSGLVQSRLENVAVETADGLELHGWFVRALPAITSGRPEAAAAPAGLLSIRS